MIHNGEIGRGVIGVVDVTDLMVVNIHWVILLFFSFCIFKF